MSQDHAADRSRPQRPDARPAVSSRDTGAFEALRQRYAPVMRRWVRLHVDALQCSEDEIDAVVQRVLDDNAVSHPRRGAELQLQLRNQLAERLSALAEASGAAVSASGSLLERSVGAAAQERYETALSHLAPEDREAVVAGIEMAADESQLAQALDKPSEGAARMTICRAIVRLAEEMARAGR